MLARLLFRWLAASEAKMPAPKQRASRMQLSGNKVPSQGNIFVSLKDEDKQKAVPLIRQLVNLGYELYATRGTSTMLFKVGIRPATCSAFPAVARTCWTSFTTRKCSGS